MHSQQTPFNSFPILYQNVIAALVVSFVALSLGASFGLLSGRGALSGMISAGVIAFVTSLIGGTRIQCSGPTAPMSAVAVAVLAAAHVHGNIGTLSVDQIFNFTVILSGMMLVLAALFRLGNAIRWIPHSVISGFMSGIAVLIWIGQVKQLFYVENQWVFDQTALLNLFIVLLTLAIVMGLPRQKNRLLIRLLDFFPPTLIAIVVCTLLVYLTQLPIETIDIETDVLSQPLSAWVSSQIPSQLSWELFFFALPLAFELALLCYLDTLMTALVMDKLTHESTQRNRELVAQGAANGIAAMVGGLPGAQATIRSVLILKEGATSRLSGILVGLFVIVELFIFLDLISLIPKAVFIGILFKVGYDVFDWTVVHELNKKRKGHYTPLDLKDLPLIILTVLITVFWNLSAAAIGATVLFYLVQKLTHNSLSDLRGIAFEDDEP